jgi:hypothetical protein
MKKIPIRKGFKPVEKVNDVLEEMPGTLVDHLAFHGEEFESMFITFAPDGTWFLSGFGGKAFGSLNQVSEILMEAAMLVGQDKETMH